MQKQIVIVVTLVVVAGICAYFISPFSDSSKKTTPSFLNTDQANTPALTPKTNRNELVESHNTQTQSTQSDISTNLNGVRLLGISYSPDPMMRMALIEIQEQRVTVYEEDQLPGSRAKIESIEQEAVYIEMDGKVHKLTLQRTESNVDEVTSQSESMPERYTKKQPDNRPTTLSQIVSLPAHYRVGEKMYVTPGLTPKLFKSARFKEGDQLLSVNGIEFTLDSFFEDVESQINTAHTLKFEVLRDGKKVVLFLDIPSETLQFR